MKSILLLSRWLIQLNYMMDHSIIFRDQKKYQAIEKIRERLELLKGKSERVHQRWLCKLHNDIITILPPSAGRYKEVRNKIIAMLDAAEKRMNSEQLRVLIQ
ncbi:MAG: hypothetical protein WAU36_06620 [Cyclobacteriaceae bacterium]